ncbi:hypothetical protein [Paenibacillus sp. LHD-38]|uniref:hypothetical protein n=1 Tax=Paenibacillus sp. LHD-38 TaxID=3072143 RepID=UPI00280E64A8|nr:hypothetical protein [Paenibacillus sp. LHD-38]MDQ8739412.1 hypothetical protein [Paenibacillus sp. LHD-38]
MSQENQPQQQKLIDYIQKIKELRNRPNGVLPSYVFNEGALRTRDRSSSATNSPCPCEKSKETNLSEEE